MYINYYGCRDYPGQYYTSDPSLADPRTGGLAYCAHPTPQPYLTVVYFVTFCLIGFGCIFSLFIAAITMSMADSVIEMKKEKIEGRRKRLRDEVDKNIRRLENPLTLDRKTKQTVRLIGLAFTGCDMELKHEIHQTDYMAIYVYHLMAVFCGDLAEHPLFQNFVTLVILLAGVNVGLVTDVRTNLHYSGLISNLNQFIQAVFVAEAVLKIVAEGLQPWMYFKSNWNKFDFIVVVGSFLPTGGSTIIILRLFRLLRVLKLMRALPALQVIVTALMKGLTSIGFIGVILGIFFYFYAVLGNTFFGANDPSGFGTLHQAFFVIFRCVTLDNWSDYMYTSLYGCDVYVGYSGICNAPNAQFAIAAIYFVSIVLLGTLILLSLFIGVVSMSMEEATEEQKEEMVIQARVLKVAKDHNLTQDVIDMYLEVFSMVDFTQQRKIGRDEMKFGLRLAGVELEKKDFERVWRKVDRDRSQGIDASEFLEFMIDLRDHRRMQDAEAKEDGPVGGRRAFEFFRRSNRVLPTGENSSLDSMDDDSVKTLESLQRLEAVKEDPADQTTGSPESFRFGAEDMPAETAVPERNHSFLSSPASMRRTKGTDHLEDDSKVDRLVVHDNEPATSGSNRPVPVVSKQSESDETSKYGYYEGHDKPRKYNITLPKLIPKSSRIAPEDPGMIVDEPFSWLANDESTPSSRFDTGRFNEENPMFDDSLDYETAARETWNTQKQRDYRQLTKEEEIGRRMAAYSQQRRAIPQPSMPPNNRLRGARIIVPRSANYATYGFSSPGVTAHSSMESNENSSGRPLMSRTISPKKACRSLVCSI